MVLLAVTLSFRHSLPYMLSLPEPSTAIWQLAGTMYSDSAIAVKAAIFFHDNLVFISIITEIYKCSL
ncbi:MAG: hypothetical protein RR341_08290, partial [Bacteroidales bacterium]